MERVVNFSVNDLLALGAEPWEGVGGGHAGDGCVCVCTAAYLSSPRKKALGLRAEERGSPVLWRQQSGALLRWKREGGGVVLFQIP